MPSRGFTLHATLDEPFIADLGPGQTLRSGWDGSRMVTREEIVATYERLREHPAPVAPGRDPTQVPIGRTAAPELQELPDGELALVHDVELFDGFVTDVPIYSQSEAAQWATAPVPEAVEITSITWLSDRRSDDDARESITLLTIDVPRDGLPPVRVEGSYAGSDRLDAFRNAGDELLAFANALIPHFRDPGGLHRLHFVFDGQAWRFHYGLDREARLAMIRVVSDAEYATLVQRAAASRN